jgi:hypothetical protein
VGLEEMVQMDITEQLELEQTEEQEVLRLRVELEELYMEEVFLDIILQRESYETLIQLEMLRYQLELEELVGLEEMVQMEVMDLELVQEELVDKLEQEVLAQTAE